MDEIIINPGDLFGALETGSFILLRFKSPSTLDFCTVPIPIKYRLLKRKFSDMNFQTYFS